MIRPLFDNIVIEKEAEETKTQSGIVLAKTERGNVLIIGKVLAVGDGRLLQDGNYDKPKLKVGDRAYFSKSSAIVVEEEGKYYYIIRETSILGVRE
jgi:chaperonin GroES